MSGRRLCEVSKLLYHATGWLSYEQMARNSEAKRRSLSGRMSILKRRKWVEGRRQDGGMSHTTEWRMTDYGRAQVADILRLNGENFPMPACFDPVSWAGWLESAKDCRADRHNYCVDCTPEHQTEMKLQERCAYPGVRFVYLRESGDYQGIRRAPQPGESLTPIAPPKSASVRGIAVPKLAGLCESLTVAADEHTLTTQALQAFLAGRREAQHKRYKEEGDDDSTLEAA